MTDISPALTAGSTAGPNGFADLGGIQVRGSEPAERPTVLWCVPRLTAVPPPRPAMPPCLS